MKAVVVRRGETRPQVIDIEAPIPREGEVLVRTLRVGIDGTDHEVIEGNHGGYPDGSDYQVLGHEAVGVVEEVPLESQTGSDDGVVDENGSRISEGDLVVPTVRRPPGDGNEYFERGEPDMAPAGMYVERGIVGAHGYMSEYFTSPPEYLVQVSDSFATHGFLVEPMSNSEKAFDHAFASRSAFDWQPESALVLGNGPLGLLTLAMLEADGSGFERTYCLGRRDRPDPTISIIERLGGTYIDSRKTPVPNIPASYESMDFVYEATGYAKHSLETIDALAPNGVGVLLGIPGDWTFEIDGGRFHREFVLHNKALVGSVNSHVKHFEAAKESLAAVPDWFSDAFITGIHSPEETEAAFATDHATIKTAIEFDTL